MKTYLRWQKLEWLQLWFFIDKDKTLLAVSNTELERNLDNAKCLQTFA